ncbi:MAG: zinc-finger domain-containing protein [Alphaproteobacteria bacterium]|nr:zinc-finger domain-containing protein [Alphaproteobacteria bacterium]
MEPTEIIAIDGETASCDGGGGPLGHPLVFLHLDRVGRVDCPYCGRRFARRAGQRAAPSH